MAQQFDPLPHEFARLRVIAGVDEVGRGPLAGPVVAAAVILPPMFPIEILDDSKVLKTAERTRVAHEIKHSALSAIIYVSAEIIDQINIRQATLLAMRRAIFALPCLPDAALIDGRDVPPGLPCPARAIISGDAHQPAIAAASIIAKVARDRLMAEAERHHPGYGFLQHAGYPTASHRTALSQLGLSPLHRRTFGPCRALYNPS